MFFSFLLLFILLCPLLLFSLFIIPRHLSYFILPFLLIFSQFFRIFQFPISIFSLHPLLPWWQNDCLSTEGILIYFITQVEKKGRLFHYSALLRTKVKIIIMMFLLFFLLGRITRRPFSINLSFRAVVEWAVHAEPQRRTEECGIEKLVMNKYDTTFFLLLIEVAQREVEKEAHWLLQMLLTLWQQMSCWW